MSVPTFVWSGSKRTNNSLHVIASNEKIHFAKNGFSSAITVDSYQDDTFEELSNGSVGQELHNIKYINNSQHSVDDGANANLTATVPAKTKLMQIKLSVDSLSFVTSNTKFFAFDGTTLSNGPSNVHTKVFEYSNTSWKNTSGSGAHLVLANQTNSSTNHIWYVCISAKPVEIGDKTAYAFHLQCDYQ